MKRAIAIAFVLLMGGCASTPPVEEYLDQRTGATIARIDQPFLLYRRIARIGDAQTQYVSLAPIHVNRAGDHRLYLWVEIPVGEHARAMDLLVDDQVLSLELATTTQRSIGLGEHSYQSFAGLGVSAYYELDADSLETLVSASSVTLDPADGKGVFVTAGAQPDSRASMRELLAVTR